MTFEQRNATCIERSIYHAMFNRACQHLRDAYRLRRMSHLRAIEIELYHECMTFARAYRNA
jgi:flagellar motor switch protein FliM